MHTKKELRAKKVDYNFKVSNHSDESERQKSITEIMDKHQKVHENISSHFKKELTTQENEFEKKMERRRERSVSRSMNKSVERKSRVTDEDKNGDSVRTTDLLQQLRISEKKKSQFLDNPFKQDF